MSRLKYFAYGSNMYRGRFRQRVLSFRSLGVSELPEFVLRFHKRGLKDGSGKCNAYFTGVKSDRVIGVVYEIRARDKVQLDTAEGLGNGYHEANVTVTIEGEEQTAFTYLADPQFIDDSLKPFTWYKAFVVYGARDHALPRSYIDQLGAVNAVPDPDMTRAKTNTRLVRSLECLSKSMQGTISLSASAQDTSPLR